MSTLILIHIGTQWPHYLKDCLKQARFVNPTAEIVIILNECHSFRILPLQTIYKIKAVFIESLSPSFMHTEFLTKITTMVNLEFRKKYWQYVFERFFILERYCNQYKPSSFYMIETDTLVYVPLTFVQTTESLFTQGMALPFDNQHQGYPCFVFFRTVEAVSKFTAFMLHVLRIQYCSDMKILALYWKHHPEEVFPYPVLPHVCNTPLRDRTSLLKLNAQASETAFLSNSQFPILFDAIALGQALGGIDPRNLSGITTVGYVNESALYTIHETQFAWAKLDKYWFPIVNGVPLVNLHIHSKCLSNFLSDNESMPGARYNVKELEQSLENDLKGSV